MKSRINCLVKPYILGEKLENTSKWFKKKQTSLELVVIVILISHTCTKPTLQLYYYMNIPL